MGDFTLDEPRPGVLCVSGELTFGSAHALHAALRDALQRHPDLEVDLLNVTKLDTAGLQLLIGLQQEAQARGKSLRWRGFSLAVAEVIELLDLAEVLGRPGVVVWS